MSDALRILAAIALVAALVFVSYLALFAAGWLDTE